MTGKDRRTGGGVATRFGAMTGDCRTTGVGSAAIKDTLVDSAVAGNLVWAAKKAKQLGNPLDRKKQERRKGDPPLPYSPPRTPA